MVGCWLLHGKEGGAPSVAAAGFKYERTMCLVSHSNVWARNVYFLFAVPSHSKNTPPYGNALEAEVSRQLAALRSDITSAKDPEG